VARTKRLRRKGNADNITRGPLNPSKSRPLPACLAWLLPPPSTRLMCWFKPLPWWSWPQSLSFRRTKTTSFNDSNGPSRPGSMVDPHFHCRFVTCSQSTQRLRLRAISFPNSRELKNQPPMILPTFQQPMYVSPENVILVNADKFSSSAESGIFRLCEPATRNGLVSVIRR
jgi:hypothetical protein